MVFVNGGDMHSDVNGGDCTMFGNYISSFSVENLVWDVEYLL